MARKAKPTQRSRAKYSIDENQRRRVQLQAHLKSMYEKRRRDEDSDDDELDSLCPKIDALVAEQGKSIFKILTPFSAIDFEQLWDHIGTEIEAQWFSGKGPKPKITAKDCFFIMLNVMHIPTKWSNKGLEFVEKGPTLEKNVWKVRWCSFLFVASLR